MRSAASFLLQPGRGRAVSFFYAARKIFFIRKATFGGDFLNCFFAFYQKCGGFGKPYFCKILLWRYAELLVEISVQSCFADVYMLANIRNIDARVTVMLIYILHRLGDNAFGGVVFCLFRKELEYFINK